MPESRRRSPRVFITDAVGEWTELTGGGHPMVRMRAANPQAAQRRRRLPVDVPVVLDVAVAVAVDSRTALTAISGHAGESTVQDLRPQAQAALRGIHTRLRISDVDSAWLLLWSQDEEAR